jgi:hypothetical protein
MSVIYLTHPIHGAKVATSNMEVDGDLANGWAIFDPSEVVPLAEVAPAPSQPEAEKPILNALPVRRGRPRK